MSSSFQKSFISGHKTENYIDRTCNNKLVPWKSHLQSKNEPRQCTILSSRTYTFTATLERKHEKPFSYSLVRTTRSSACEFVHRRSLPLLRSQYPSTAASDSSGGSPAFLPTTQIIMSYIITFKENVDCIIKFILIFHVELPLPYTGIFRFKKPSSNST